MAEGKRGRRWRHLGLAALTVSLVLAVFGAVSGCANDSDRDALWVFAASSLTDAFTEIADAFEQANPNIEVRTQFAGSSQLAAQIASGAPADVFASANEAVMETLLPGGELARTRISQPVVFARNELVIAAPTDNPKGIASLADLTDRDLLLAICDDGVPCGTLAHEAATTAGIELRPDTEEANVRAVLAKLLLGEVDAGLIYKSDVVATPLVAIPISPAPTADYPIISLTEHPDAERFVDSVLSETSQGILKNYGFASTTR